MHDRPADSMSAGELSIESASSRPRWPHPGHQGGAFDTVGCIHVSARSRLGRPRKPPNVGHAGHDREVGAYSQNPQRRDDISREQSNGEDEHVLAAPGDRLKP